VPPETPSSTGSFNAGGSLEANEVESRVWAAVERILNDPDVIQAEVARQHAEADQTRAEILPLLELIETALRTCDREETRWAEAYAAEVINVRELKAYRADIAIRRERLHAERATVQARLDAIGHLDSQAQALVAYCERVRQNLHTFTAAERRRALDALDVRVFWTPGEPLKIEATIPLSDDAITPIAATRYTRQRRPARPTAVTPSGYPSALDRRTPSR
jgi:hypothetical protein